jgi:hypothetical protein
MFGLFKKMHEESSEISKLHVNIKKALQLLDEAERVTINFSGDYNRYQQLKGETLSLTYLLQIAVFDKFNNLSIKADEDDIGALQPKLLNYESSVNEIRVRVRNLAEKVGVTFEMQSIFDKDSHYHFIESTISSNAYKKWGFK